MNESKRSEFISRLQDAQERLGLSLSSQTIDRLVSFVFFLEKWNKAFNLTSVRRSDEILRRHVIDSLTVVPFIEGNAIADVGSGGGIPGIPLAIVFPDKHFTLIDSNGKKTRFITQAKMEFGLDNLEAVQTRVEDYQPEAQFEQIVTRGFADVALSLKLLDHLWGVKASCLLMKGPAVYEELKQLDSDLFNTQVIELDVPETSEQRFLLKITRKDN